MPWWYSLGHPPAAAPENPTVEVSFRDGLLIDIVVPD